MAGQQIIAKFEKEKVTKNTVRFSEVAEEIAPYVGTIYVQKWALQKLGMPNTIVVTIETASPEVFVE